MNTTSPANLFSAQLWLVSPLPACAAPGYRDRLDVALGDVRVHSPSDPDTNKREPRFFLRASPNPACIMRRLITVDGIQGSDSRGSQAG